MAEIDYKKMAVTVLGDTRLKLEDLNVAMFVRLPGETNPAGAPSTAPVPVRGMKDVADKFKPAIEVKLTDEKGADTPQKVRYHRGVKGGQDLARNFDPRQVVLRMENADADDPRLGLLLRLLVARAAMDGLREALQAGQTPSAEVVERLKAERARVVQALAELEKELPAEDA